MEEGPGEQLLSGADGFRSGQRLQPLGFRVDRLLRGRLVATTDAVVLRL